MFMKLLYVYKAHIRTMDANMLLLLHLVFCEPLGGALCVIR